MLQHPPFLSNMYTFYCNVSNVRGNHLPADCQATFPVLSIHELATTQIPISCTRVQVLLV